MFDAKRATSTGAKRDDDSRVILVGVLALVTASAWALVFERYGINGFATVVVDHMGALLGSVHDVADASY